MKSEKRQSRYKGIDPKLFEDDADIEAEVIGEAALDLGYDDWATLADKTIKVLFFKHNELNDIFDRLNGKKPV